MNYQRVADFLTAVGVCAWSVDRLMIGLLSRTEARPDRSVIDLAARSP